MTGLALAFALSFAASLAVETMPPSLRAFRAPPKALLLRLAVHLALFAALFALSWRPWHAAFVVTVTTGLFAAGSNVKQGILGEPLIFTDAALVRHAIRHPRLYYAERLARPPALAALATLLVATVLWFAIEPSILPRDAPTLVLAPPAIVLGLWAALGSAPVAAFARSVVADPADADGDVRRFGLVAALVLHWLAWRSATRPSEAAMAAAAALPAPRPAAEGPRVVVAIQCESFVDIAARGFDGPPLPALDRLRAEALAWGRCRVPAEGAYTMRSEFAFLTGLAPEALGLDAFDPYLTAEPYLARSLPALFAASGRATTFLHPYDRRFFDRHLLVPKFGFGRFVHGEAFAGAARFGPYVADSVVADALVAEIKAALRPAFLFAVTIENHGPWGPGRLPQTDDAAAQYALHLANADRMIGRVAEALRALPGGGVLCLYGDHAPGLTLHRELPDRRATDYLLWDSRKVADSPAAPETLDVSDLARRLLAAV
ncbi:LTA synthase family protein [Methylopila turkensis]|uniref:Sulfatase n=1 Tax=Methylopila turkensis TaxID=1437816 RepID=A0A9W6JN05_9HYPH|nr:LTA synthase family protein [Methylopila turkensis]GLK80177.1 sulfatase [Methylopila turkensis]